MAQPQAAQRTRNAAIVALAAQELQRLWPNVDWDSPHALAAVQRFYGAIVAKYGQSSAAVAAEFYDALRATKDLPSGFRASPSDAMPQAQIDAAVQSAFLGNVHGHAGTTSDLPVAQRVEQRLTDSLQRRVLQPARDTIADNAAVDPAKPRYVRVPTGTTTCAFCVMLASRELGKRFGGYYATNVKFDEEHQQLHVFAKNGAKFHDHCDCEAVPVFPGQKAADVSPNVADYQRMYYKATAEAGTHSDAKKILAAMRKLHGLK